MNKIGSVLPWTMLIALIVVVIAWVIVERTSLGRTILAVGGNAEAAHPDGPENPPGRDLCLCLFGWLRRACRVFLASGYGAGQPLEGAGWELAAIAAVVVGGTLLTGGMGSVPVTVAGALLFGVVFNLLNFENGRGTISLSANWQSVIRGLFLLVVILLQVRLARPAARNEVIMPRITDLQARLFRVPLPEVMSGCQARRSHAFRTGHGDHHHRGRP